MKDFARIHFGSYVRSTKRW